MREKEKDQKGTDESPSDVSRRDFIALSSAGVLDSLPSPASGHELSVIETDVKFNTPDGTCDAAFFHPKEGSHAGVLIWPDSLGLRPALRDLGRKIAAEGYSALVPNHLYRRAKAPVFDKLFDMKRSEDREEYFRILDPFLAPGAAERDAAAFVDFLDAQWQVNKRKKIGIASDDDGREPDAKTKLTEAFAAANVRAEIEVYPKALHGWCVPDNKAAADNKQDAERAWAKLLALYKEAL